MKKMGIFFGSDTGNTEKIAKIIQKQLSISISNIYDIANTKITDIESFDILIFGVPTWYYGELQCDWDDFLPELKKINFGKKTIAFFGCGDQEDYAEYFCDGIGILYNVIKKTNPRIIGKWSTKGYCFVRSKALYNKNLFVGLIIDEDRQPEKSKSRITKWTNQIKDELKLILP